VNGFELLSEVKYKVCRDNSSYKAEFVLFRSQCRTELEVCMRAFIFDTRNLEHEYSRIYPLFICTCLNMLTRMRHLKCHTSTKPRVSLTW
jgi:hypothetical protein